MQDIKIHEELGMQMQTTRQTINFLHESDIESEIARLKEYRIACQNQKIKFYEIKYGINYRNIKRKNEMFVEYNNKGEAIPLSTEKIIQFLDVEMQIEKIRLSQLKNQNILLNELNRTLKNRIDKLSNEVLLMQKQTITKLEKEKAQLMQKLKQKAVDLSRTSETECNQYQHLVNSINNALEQSMSSQLRSELEGLSTKGFDQTEIEAIITKLNTIFQLIGEIQLQRKVQAKEIKNLKNINLEKEKTINLLNNDNQLIRKEIDELRKKKTEKKRK